MGVLAEMVSCSRNVQEDGLEGLGMQDFSVSFMRGFWKIYNAEGFERNTRPCARCRYSRRKEYSCGHFALLAYMVQLHYLVV